MRKGTIILLSFTSFAWNLTINTHPGSKMSLDKSPPLVASQKEIKEKLVLPKEAPSGECRGFDKQFLVTITNVA